MAAVSTWLATLGGSGWVTNEPAPGVAPFGASYTWAAGPKQIPAASAAPGWKVYVSDVGIGGTFFQSDGARWRAEGGAARMKNLITPISNNGAPKIVMDSFALPAGVWNDGDILTIRGQKQRLGGTADTDTTDIMLGTVAGTLGTSMGLTLPTLATTNVQMDFIAEFRKESATSVRAMSSSAAGLYGLGAATAASVVITGLPNMNTQTTYVQITSDLTTAAGEVAWLTRFEAELRAGS